MANEGKRQPSWGWFMHLRLRRQRLAASISVLREEWQGRPDGPWKAAANTMLESAEQAGARGHLLVGWKHFHAARRLGVGGLSAAELAVVATGLRKEAEAGHKLRSWRKEAVLALLKPPPPPPPPPAPPPPPVAPTSEQVVGAMELLDDGMDNGYMRSDLARNQMVLLLLVLLANLAGFWVLARTQPQWTRLTVEGAPGAVTAGGDGLLMLGVMLMGAVGGAFSALTSLVGSVGAAGKRRVPDQILDGYVTSLRPALGAAGALIVFLFLTSGVLQLSSLGPAAILSAAFVAGFTDRLVLRGINVVVGEDGKG